MVLTKINYTSEEGFTLAEIGFKTGINNSEVLITGFGMNNQEALESALKILMTTLNG